ncbi:MAG: arginine--tRNA ligase [Candidatus Nanoarchaeia archaeon]
MAAFEEEVSDLLKVDTGLDEVKLEVPPNPTMGDFAFACFNLAKEKKKSPVEIAKELCESLPASSLVEKVQALGPYVNIFLNKPAIAEQILGEVVAKGNKFGHKEPTGHVAVVEFSAPNIAKPFGIGHLRSTVIGNSLVKLYKTAGYTVVAANHYGDYGTQFGKMIVAYKLWGEESKLQDKPIDYLYSLYVQFHKEAEQNEKLNEEAREWFAKLEAGDGEAVKLWEMFRELSLFEFNRVYDLLQVSFDTHHGEAFYTSRLMGDVETVKKAGIAEMSEGALIVDLSDINCPPLMLLKSNGTSTYHTRDLAAAFYRLDEHKPDKLVYVVGSEQQLHFKQLFTVMGMLGHPLEKFEHVSFGRVNLPEGKMSTRKGTIVLMEHVLDKSVQLALKIINEKNPKLKNKEQVAKWVGIGAVVFGDLVNDRNKDVTFSWERILDFEGETGPYLQYTHARAGSIIRKAGGDVKHDVEWGNFNQQEEYNVIMQLTRYESVLEDCVKNSKPHILCHYLLTLAQSFNEFYHKCPVISDRADIQKARLLLVFCVQQVLKNGLGLIGLHAPDEM